MAKSHVTVMDVVNSAVTSVHRPWHLTLESSWDSSALLVLSSVTFWGAQWGVVPKSCSVFIVPSALCGCRVVGHVSSPQLIMALRLFLLMLSSPASVCTQPWHMEPDLLALL